MTPLMSSCVILGHSTSQIHKNYNFDWRIIVPLGFDSRNKCTPLKNRCPSWSLFQDFQIAN